MSTRFPPVVAISVALVALWTAVPSSSRWTVERHVPDLEPVIAEPIERNFRYGVDEARLRAAANANATATFIVTYDSGFQSNTAAQAAFQKALDLWSNLIVSAVPIRVTASYLPFQQSGLLGFAGFQSSCTGGWAPLSNTYYPPALADKLAGSDVCRPGQDDIYAQFNSDFSNWSFDTTGAATPGQYSFATVALHEIAHGLGFVGSMTVVGGQGAWTGPFPYDNFAENGSLQPLLSFTNGSSQLAAQLVSNNIFWNGLIARNSNGNVRPKLETSLNPWVSGSSYVHVDDATYNGTPNALMTYAFGTNEVIYAPGPIVLGMFADMGWATSSCSYSISPASNSFSSTGGSGTVSVTTGAGCAWTATSNASFITVTSGATGNGSGTVGYSVASSTAARSGTITIAGQTFSVSQSAPAPVPCTYSLTPASANFSSSGGTGNVTLNTQAGCAWSAASNNGFITVTSAPTGSGTGAVSYSVAGGALSPRTGTIAIGGQTFTVSQAGCTFSLSRSSTIVPLAGGSGTVAVATETGCSWIAASNDAFLTIASGAAGTGSGGVGYSVASATSARTGTITIAGNTFTVTQTALPILSLSPAAVNFGATINASGTLLTVTPAQTLALTRVGAGSFTWTAASNQSWLTVSPASGSGPATLTVSINSAASGLPFSGAVSGTITVTAASTGAANNPTATSILTLAPQGQATAAIGSFDTPTAGQTGVTGSIAVTGWAIDDIGVQRVRIVRDPIAGEGAAQIFIGNASFVAGARTDIAALYPTRPLKDQAGWGYLLLTNFLPNQGNGTFTLHAYADDVEGNAALLGSKTIGCANATATAPFGAIDTPVQGGTVSGTFLNFGWVLTPPPASIAANASTIGVLIDSVGIGSPSDGGPLSARSDIQALFGSGGYANINSSLGVKTINSLSLSNGVHTIAWIVTDSLGRSSGIGSRYFTVANSGVMAGVTKAGDSFVAQGFSPAPGRKAEALRYESGVIESGVIQSGVIDATRPVRGALSSLADLVTSGAAIAVTRGLDANAIPDEVMPDADGVRHVRVAPLERVVIDLDPMHEGGAFRGYTIDGPDSDVLRGLPVGSHFDSHTGEFAWMPGLAFGGTHEFVFVREASSPEQIRVRITVR